MGAPGRTRAHRGGGWCGPRSPLIRIRWHVCRRPSPPMCAHERPSVPEGSPRCQGVLASMGAHGRTRAHRGGGWRGPRSPLIRIRWHVCRRPSPPMCAHERPSIPEGSPRCQEGLAPSGDHSHQVVTSGDQLKLPSDELNCRSKRRFSDLTPQDCIFRSRNQRLRRGLGWVFG